MNQFSEIEAVRAARGIKQNVLAERAGMKPQDYSRLKKPSKYGPTARTLSRLVNALNQLVQEKEQADG